MKCNKVWSSVKLLPLLLGLLLVEGCSKPLMDSVEAASPAVAVPADPGVVSRIAPVPVNIPAGTPIAVRLQTSVSSRTSAAGQRFEAALVEPLVVNGQVFAPRGAPVMGRVVAARKSGHLHKPGYLRLALASVTVNGRSVPVATTSVSAQGGSHKKRNWAFIGGGTGGGALIGALAGGGKGALIGTAIGAASGTTGAYFTGRKDVGFGAERRLTFRLVEPVQVRS